ncbi:hypothetical protein ACVWZA_003694 [Sphingomonas sp. UYAg733]
MDYLSLLATRADPIPPGDVTKLEALMGGKLTESYAEYLGQSNGGSFRADIVDLPFMNDATVLNYMYSTVNPDYNIFEEYKMLRGMDRIPEQALPIADDPGGNVFLISFESKTYGNVFFWDHEREPGDGGSRIADFPNMTLLANDFAVFISGLTSGMS